MLVITAETLRNSFAQELNLLHEEFDGDMDELDEAWMRAHAKRTVLEQIECQVAQMFDRMEAEREEMINKLWYG